MRVAHGGAPGLTIYEYAHPRTGQVIEREFRMGTAPPSVRYQGLRYKRAPSLPAVRVSEGFHFQSAQLPLRWKHAPRHDPITGECRFDSADEVRETVQRAQAAGEPVAFDFAGDATRQRTADRHKRGGVSAVPTARELHARSRRRKRRP